MMTFRYSAKDAAGQTVNGELTASNLEEVRRTLEQQGLEIVEASETSLVASHSSLPPRMSNNEVEEWTEHLAHLSATNLPLAAGFRAAAEESVNPRVAAAMQVIAAEIEKGIPLERVLQESSPSLPSHIGGLVAAAARTGSLGEALADLVAQQREARATRRRIWDGFAYPIAVGVMASILILLLVFLAGNAFERLFQEFQIQLPFLTKLLFWWRDIGIWLMAASVFAFIVAAWAWRWLRGEAAWLKLVSTVPLFGPLGHWLRLAEWSRLLAVLLKHRVPMPEALRLSSEGIRRGHLQEFARALAAGADRGQAISDLLSQAPEYPRAMIPIVQWGEKSGLLPQAFELGSQMFEQRVENRSAVLQFALPPLLFIGIGCCVLLVAGGLFFPMTMLLRALS